MGHAEPATGGGSASGTGWHKERESHDFLPRVGEGTIIARLGTEEEDEGHPMKTNRGLFQVIVLGGMGLIGADACGGTTRRGSTGSGGIPVQSGGGGNT